MEARVGQWNLCPSKPVLSTTDDDEGEFEDRPPSSRDKDKSNRCLRVFEGLVNSVYTVNLA